MEIGSDLLLSQFQQTGKDTKTNKLQSKLSDFRTEDATDEEMMEVCKEFEAYLVEKVMKQVKEAMTSGEDEKGEYMTYFGDMLYQEYAKQIAESGELGIAKQLYESMKQNTISPVKSKLQEVVSTESVSGAAGTEEE